MPADAPLLRSPPFKNEQPSFLFLFFKDRKPWIFLKKSAEVDKSARLGSFCALLFSVYAFLCPGV